MGTAAASHSRGVGLPVQPGIPGVVPAVIATAGILAAALAGIAFDTSAATVVACVAILMFGLPHGALDIELIRVEGDGRLGVARILAVYLSIAGGVAALWLIAPVAALASFIIVAVVHFADDWTALPSRVLAGGLAGALIAAPALLHRAAVAAIFVALTGSGGAARLADLLSSVAPAALALAAVSLAWLIAAGRTRTAAAAAASLAALVVLPPVPGFAVFFCLFHSPRHFVAALQAARRWRVTRWLPIVAPVTAAALAGVTLLYLRHGELAVSQRLTAATFMMLAILTMPHMLAPLALRRRAQP